VGKGLSVDTVEATPPGSGLPLIPTLTPDQLWGSAFFKGGFCKKKPSNNLERDS